MIYLVNQGKTYQFERNGSYIWSPKRDRSGKANRGYSLMEKVHRGDYILHNSGGRISAISVVQEDCKSGHQPSELKSTNMWDDDGWMIKTKYYDFDTPLLTADLIEWARNNYIKGSAFAVNGKLAQQYLCSLAIPHADYLLRKAESSQTGSDVINVIQTARKNALFGEYYSWNIIEDDVAVKKADKSFFEHNGSAVPKEIRWFFNCEELKQSQSKKIEYYYKGKQYSGRIMIDPYDRCRVFWSVELGHEFESLHRPDSKDYPYIRFQRLSPEFYHVDLIDETLVSNEKEDPLQSEVTPQKEGKKKEYYTTKYERNPVNRKNAILIHGTRCMVCGFDFEAFYGEAGRNYIEVHHIRPLSDAGEEISIDPEKDLVCVCSNCHRIIHRKKDKVYSLDEVKKMIEQAREA